MGKRNPNNYGCVTKLKGKRSRPWIVKVTVYDSEGRARQVPVDYAETEEQANIILAQYNNNPWNIDRNGPIRSPSCATLHPLKRLIVYSSLRSQMTLLDAI